ncbi:hypothetical protein AVEN_45116-1 [Araneus ventricosus]|uniref:Uncharacterized protein n=1 Tax=Araneus ventricosus TaxID=182803 RepID=A0A4Y2MF85_ARAVE|nr:hypothetical protein AVEN_45116-1 [Araneus ventricosus]
MQHPCECPTKEKNSLEAGEGITTGTGTYTNGSPNQKMYRGSIFRLVKTRHSPHIVGKNARRQYSIPGETVCPETRNRLYNYPPSPANDHSNRQLNEFPGSSQPDKQKHNSQSDLKEQYKE